MTPTRIIPIVILGAIIARVVVIVAGHAGAAAGDQLLNFIR